MKTLIIILLGLMVIPVTGCASAPQSAAAPSSQEEASGPSIWQVIGRVLGAAASGAAQGLQQASQQNAAQTQSLSIPSPSYSRSVYCTSLRTGDMISTQCN